MCSRDLCWTSFSGGIAMKYQFNQSINKLILAMLRFIRYLLFYKLYKLLFYKI